MLVCHLNKHSLGLSIDLNKFQTYSMKIMCQNCIGKISIIYNLNIVFLIHYYNNNYIKKNCVFFVQFKI